jgi:hypothetical protein
VGEISKIVAVTLDIPDWPAEDLRRFVYHERVYFALAPTAGLVKVGTTFRLAERMQELRLMSPVPLELIGHVPGGAEREQAYHQLFAAERSHGEWFRYTEAVAAKLESDNLVAIWNSISQRARRRFVDMLSDAAGVDLVAASRLEDL